MNCIFFFGGFCISNGVQYLESKAIEMLAFFKVKCWHSSCLQYALIEYAMVSVIIHFHTAMACDNHRKNRRHSVRMGTANIDSARKQAERALIIDSFFSFLSRVGVYVVATCVFRLFFFFIFICHTLFVSCYSVAICSQRITYFISILLRYRKGSKWYYLLCLYYFKMHVNAFVWSLMKLR